jgi:hypothetical protein
MAHHLASREINAGASSGDIWRVVRGGLSGLALKLENHCFDFCVELK